MTNHETLTVKNTFYRNTSSDRATHACPKVTRKVNSAWGVGSTINELPRKMESSARTASGALKHCLDGIGRA